jgi:ubiquinone/menaquinone biosynthesis C-methylase UbiE
MATDEFSTAETAMDKKRTIIDFFDREAPTRSRKRKRFGYFYRLTENYLRFYVPEGSSVLLVGCGTGEMLHALKPSRGVGIDISGGMIGQARKNFPQYEFHTQDVESLNMDETFDVVIFSDVIGYLDDIQTTLQRIQSVCDENTRVMITYFSIFWQFPLRLAEKAGLKMTSPFFAWLEPDDIANLLDLAGFDIIRKNLKILFPLYIPLLSFFFNFFLANLPIIRRLCLLEIVSARLRPSGQRREQSVAVLIPTRNEKGNIAAALDRLPALGSHTEVIFVDGHSTDGTLEEVERQAALRPHMDISWYSQDGKGKGDAVRKGFSLAKSDILMILDADLTVPPEELPKFYEALVEGKGEFINGSRMVYPMEDRAMRFLNVLGNKFFSIVFTWLLDQRFKDTLCGTKVLTRENYLKVAANRSYFGDFDPFGDFDLIFGAAKLNLKITEIPIRYRERTYGSTNISRFRHGLILLRMCLYAYKKIKMI